MQHYFDNTLSVEIPEGIDIQTELAGPVVRGLALALDLFHRGWIFLVISLVMGFALGDASGGFLLIAWFMLEWFYPVFFEITRGGQTPGKKSFNLVVVNDDLTPVRFEASVIRNLLRAVDFLPVAYVIGLVSMVCSKDFKRLGDFAAGTLVVYKPKPEDIRGVSKGESYPLPHPVDHAQQQALVAFLLRNRDLSPSRVEELAAILSPLHQVQGEKAVKRVLGYGRSLIGEPIAQTTAQNAPSSAFDVSANTETGQDLETPERLP
ncbi:Uncharacterised protein [BD1-7 clade bacterium]|uniref:RDD domain-containing protein n=1 Tax=BD1-7 clade bacterium TaxID=2029982 RepID=A0A5S9PPL6_9GAMM|nr:Uncharacterised protein [BD1-7 clade bacterium]